VVFRGTAGRGSGQRNGGRNRTRDSSLAVNEDGRVRTFPVANAGTDRAILKVSDEREKTEYGAVVEFGAGTRD
jgi:hypothetical protein